MYRVGQLPETGYQTIVMQAELVPAAQSPFPIHGSHLDYDQAEAAPGARLVVLYQPIRDPAAVRGKAGCHRRYRKAVPDLQLSDLKGLKENLVFIRHAGTPYLTEILCSIIGYHFGREIEKNAVDFRSLLLYE
jgi:hypothetical protein